MAEVHGTQAYESLQFSRIAEGESDKRNRGWVRSADQGHLLGGVVRSVRITLGNRLI